MRRTQIRRTFPTHCCANFGRLPRASQRPPGRTIAGREGPARLPLLPARGRRRRPAAAQVRHAPARRSGSRRTCSRPTTRSGSTATTSCRRRRRRGCTARATSGRSGRQAGRGAARHGGRRARARRRRGSFGRRLLVPDENVTWNLTAIPAAIRLVARARGSTSCSRPRRPRSVHLIGAAVQGARRARAGSPTCATRSVAHPHRRPENAAARAEGEGARPGSRGSSRGAPTRSSRRPTRSPRRRARSSPRGEVCTIANGCDFDDFDGLEYHPSDRFRITHAGSFFGKRDPRPFLTALAESGLEDVIARFVGDFRACRPRVGGDARARRPPRAARLRAAPPLARAPARLRGAAAADPGGGRPRPRRALGEGVRVPRGRAADPRRRAAGRRRRAS